MITKEFQDKWLKALTDGSFERVRSKLVDSFDTTKRCCLGVALALLGSENLGAVYLDDENLEKIGINYDFPNDGNGRSMQYILSEANDNNSVPEGQYYPKEVIDIITALPTAD